MPENTTHKVVHRNFVSRRSLLVKELKDGTPTVERKAELETEIKTLDREIGRLGQVWNHKISTKATTWLQQH